VKNLLSPQNASRRMYEPETHKCTRC